METYYRDDEHLRGVGGWLMILILSLAFVSPFFQLRIAVRTFETLLSAKVLSQPAIVRLSIVVAIYAGLATFSLVSGIMLWSSNPRAPGVTKAYLIISVLAVSVMYSSYRIAGFDLQLSRIVFNRVVYGCFWYAYLMRSRRVQLTYSEPAGITPASSPSSLGVV